MKIVILDGYCENPGDLSWDALAALGELTVYDRTDDTDPAQIAQRIGDAEIIVINKTPITRQVIDACPSLRFITIMATGYNVVDCAYAAQKGIAVANVPAYGTAAVAQFAIALLLEICMHVGDHAEAVQEGRWAACADFCFWDTPLIELDGMTMGIIGFGRIGRQVGRIARAMGMRVLAYTRTETEEGRAIAEYVPLDTLLAEADVISLHCPLFPETAGIINRESIAKMKDGAILINNSRGGLIVEQDLANALNSGKLCAAGLDVASGTDPRGQPAAAREKLHHHAAHLVGGETVPRPDPRADRGECEGISGREARERRQSVRTAALFAVVSGPKTCGTPQAAASASCMASVSSVS